MKIKLYLVQETKNESSPPDCVGKLSIFLSKEERDAFYNGKDQESEYYSYKSFDEEIELPLIDVTDIFINEMEHVLEEGFSGGSDLNTIEKFVEDYKRLRKTF